MLRFAIQNVLSRPVRTVLSILSLTVAIAGMVGLYSIAGGIETVVASTFRLIPGLLVQQRGAPVPIFSSLPAAWETELEAIPGVAVVNPEIISRVNTINNKTIITPPRFLVGMEIESRLRLKQSIYGQFVQAGRFLTLDDRRTRNAVISRQIADEFQLALHDTLTVNGVSLTVVGIYECGSMLLDVNILLDIDTVREITRFDPGSVSCYYIEQDGTVDDVTLAREIETRFGDRLLKPVSIDLADWIPVGGEQFVPPWLRGLLPILRWWRGLFPLPASAPLDVADAGESAEPFSPVEVRSANDWAERFQEMSADLDLFLALMTAIGVIIAVISIINTMLMSVSERTIEFGILRANGWSRHNLLQLITVESGLLGVSGGLLGALCGWLATLLLNQVWPDRLQLHASVWLLGFAVLFSTFLGVLGGLYPAWLAGRMAPMDAIRRG